MTNMRAKLRVSSVTENIIEGVKNGERLTMSAVAASSYPSDGSDENNTFARYSPDASFSIYVANPALFGGYKVGEEYYVDFTLAKGIPTPQPE